MEEIEKILHRAKEIRLTSPERDSIRRRILSYLRVSPVRGEGEVRLNAQVSGWFLARPKLMPIGLIVALFIATSGGISLAAEGALPGDLLYPIKVSVNEEVRAVLAVSLESQAGWEAERLERRLEEAEQLVEQGRLQPETRATIEEHFSRHSQRLEERITEIESAGRIEAAAEVNSNLEGTLRVHERILEALVEGRATSTTGEVQDLLMKVKASSRLASSTRSAIEARVSAKAEGAFRASAEGRLKAAEAKIREVRSFIEKEKARLGEESIADAQTRLVKAEQVMADGRVKLEAGAYGEAFSMFQKAHRMAQEAKLLVEVRHALDLDVDLTNGQEDDGGDETATTTVSATARVRTRLGELTLSLTNDTLTLEGRLLRPTPCVDWQVEVEAEGRADEPSRLEFRVVDKNRGALCIQVLGEPQRISATAKASADTRIEVFLEDDEVFEGHFRGERSSNSGQGQEIRQELQLKARGGSSASVEIENSVQSDIENSVEGASDIQSRLRSILFGD